MAESKFACLVPELEAVVTSMVGIPTGKPEVVIDLPDHHLQVSGHGQISVDGKPVHVGATVGITDGSGIRATSSTIIVGSAMAQVSDVNGRRDVASTGPLAGVGWEANRRLSEFAGKVEVAKGKCNFNPK